MTATDAGHGIDHRCLRLPSGMSRPLPVLLLSVANLAILCNAGRFDFVDLLGHDLFWSLVIYGVPMLFTALGVIAGARPVSCSLALAATPTSVFLYDAIVFKRGDFPQASDYLDPLFAWFDLSLMVYFFILLLLLVSVGYGTFAGCKRTIWRDYAKEKLYFRRADAYCLILACVAVPLLILLSHAVLLHTSFMEYVPLRKTM